MARKVYEESFIAKIAQKIRALTGGSKTYKTSEMSDGVDEVYEAGKKAEYDEFWDTFQQNGNRTYYSYGFAGPGWDNATFKPKYPCILSGSAQYMFESSGLTDFDFVENGIVLDLSNATAVTYMFRSAKGIKRVGVLNVTNCKDLNRPFYGSNIETIDSLVVTENTKYDNTFQDCSAIKNLNVSGVIGQNNFYISGCKQLSKASIESIINALSTTTEGLTVTLSTAAVNKAFETSEGANDGIESAEWKTLKETKSNWNIGYA